MRRGRALRRRYGHASARKVVHLPHQFKAAVSYDKAGDRYRVIFSWPEISNEGVVSPQIQHELVKGIDAPAVLVRLTDVSKPGSQRALDEAVRTIIEREPDIRHIQGWLAQHAVQLGGQP